MQTSLAAPYLGMACASGHDMLTQLQQDLGTLTPSLRRVAQYCIAHGVPAQVLLQGSQLNPNPEGNLHVHLD